MNTQEFFEKVGTLDSAVWCGEVRLILGSRIGASPKSTTGQEDRTEEKKAGGASRMYLSPTSVPSLPL